MSETQKFNRNMNLDTKDYDANSFGIRLWTEEIKLVELVVNNDQSGEGEIKHQIALTNVLREFLEKNQAKLCDLFLAELRDQQRYDAKYKK